ncbi:HdeD family acid-resistance protein [Geodermatophilus sp. SYSU D00758]
MAVGERSAGVEGRGAGVEGRGAGEDAADALDGILAARAARYWWVVLLTGIAWLFVSWLVLRMDVGSLVAVGVLMGVVFLAAAVEEAALAATVRGGWKVLHWVVAVGFALAAGWAFVRPIETFFALASVLGLVLLVMGAFDIARAVAGRAENPYWWTGLVSGVLLLLLAFWVSSSDRGFELGTRAVLLLLWVGFMALFRGFSHIMLAFGLRRLTAGSAPPVPAPPAPTGTREAPGIPVQDRTHDQVRPQATTS